jgi:NADH:ubiquinone oxidoreductase subunit 2 (subunit N)
MVSLYYYLSIIRAMFMRSAEVPVEVAAVGGSPPGDPLLEASVIASLAVVFGSFFGLQPLIDVATHAANSLPF